MRKLFTLLFISLLSVAMYGQAIFPDQEEGIEEGFIQEINIYPNPTTNGSFSLKLETTTDEEVTVKVYNLIGKEILAKNLQVFQGLNEEIFNLNGKPKGVYILEISNGDMKEIRRVSYI